MEEIKTVQELLSNRENWCQGYLALNKCNEPIDPWDSKACRWCLFGAIQKVYGRNTIESSSIFKKFREYLIKNYPEFTITIFNDTKYYEDIMLIVKECNI